MADGSVIISTKLDNTGIKKDINGLENNFKKLGNIAGTAFKGMTIAVGTVATAFAGIVTASVNARGEIEQQIGGVKKLFTTEMGDASETVIDNANKAYKSAGLSAVDYMSTVTGFSASLISSLGGDTEKAAKIADRAIIDMSDNANTFGTDISLIQNAYQGFAKQNYTMLDNLKLGYGGTKTEMERLVKDASKMKDIQKELNVEVKEGDLSFANIAQAITVVQKQMGVLGTTEKEASETLQGSLSAMKASWNNFLSGAGDLSQVVDTVTNVVGNIVRIVNEAIPDIIESITTSLPKFAELGADMLIQLTTGISSHLPQLMATVVEVIQTLMQTFIENLPQLIEIGIQVIVQLIQGIAEMMPELIPQIVDCVILIVETLIDNIDLLIDAGIQLILALADGLIEALPRLIEKIPEIIEKLFNAFVRNFPRIVEAGGQLIGKLIVGLIGSLGTLLSKAPQIISTIVQGLKSGWDTLKNAGLNLVKGIWEGISGSIQWLKNKIKTWVGNVTSFIKNLFGIHSPSKLFRDEIGQYLGLGLGEGFEDSLSGVYKDMKKAVDYENAKLTSNLTSSHQISLTNEDNRQSRLESIDNNKEIVVKAETNLDGKVLTSTVNRVNAKQKLQYGIA